MKPQELLLDLLKEEGAVAAGIAEAAPVEESHFRRFEEWLAKGWHAGMEYMERHADLRRDPRLLLPGARSVVSVAFNYRREEMPSQGVAAYALGEDYHKTLRKKLKRVVAKMREAFGGDWRICIDSAPVLERYWAEKCGIGKRSNLHGNIVVEGAGSMVLLAELLTTLKLQPGSRNFTEESENFYNSDSSEAIYPCPTGALASGGSVDAQRCLNYLTIEHRGDWTDKQKAIMARAPKGLLFGCDACLRNAPENSGKPTRRPTEFEPSLDVEELRKLLGEVAEKGMTEEIRKRVEALIARSPLKRAGAEGLLRNFKGSGK